MVSAVPSIIQAEAELRTRLQAQQVGPVEARVGQVEAALLAQQNTLTGWEVRMSGFETTLGGYGTRIAGLEGVATSAAAALAEHASRISVLELGLRVVQTYEQLVTALAVGGVIGVFGTITCPTLPVTSVNGTRLTGIGQNAKLVVEHDPAGVTARTVLQVAAKDVRIEHLELTSNHPLTSHTGVWDVGIELSTAGGVDVSGLTIFDCHIHHVGTCILRPTVYTAPQAGFVKILFCNLHSFIGHGVWIDTNCRGAHVEFNRIFGKDTGDTHTTTGNGIRAGNNGNFIQINFNEIAFIGRHPIEYWNSQTEAATATGNICGKIIGNAIHDCQFTPFDSGTIGPASFCISAFGRGIVQIIGNSLQTGSIGIETYGDPVNNGGAVVIGNFIDQMKGQAISINNLRWGIFADNVVGRVDPGTGDGSECYGIQIINGCEGVTIRGNRFYNSGNRTIVVNGARMTITGISQAADGVFTCSAAVPTGKFYVGKTICVRDVAGMTEVNDRYLTITWVSGNQFRCGLDTSGFGAYSSGGIVQEKYRGLVIEGNDFYVDEVINAAANSWAIWVYDLQQAVIQSNKRFYKSGLSGVAAFQCSNKGEIYQDGTGTPLVVNSGTSNITGSNLSIPIFT